MSSSCGLRPLGVADSFDLIEAGDRVSDVLGVSRRLLALLRERERLVRQVVLVGGAQLVPLGGLRLLLPPRPRRSGLRQVLAGGVLLLRCRHIGVSSFAFGPYPSARASKPPGDSRGPAPVPACGT